LAPAPQTALAKLPAGEAAGYTRHSTCSASGAFVITLAAISDRRRWDMAEALPLLAWEKVFVCLGVYDLLAVRSTESVQSELVQNVAALLVSALRRQPFELGGGPGPGVRWLLALAEAQSPPRLIAAGGYNSEWNDHDTVLQDSDADGCEQSVEVALTLWNSSGHPHQRQRLLPRMRECRADLVLVSGGEGRCMLYALGGRHGNRRHASAEALDLLQWRLTEQPWTPLPPMSVGRSGLVAGVVQGGLRLIAAGGRGDTGVMREAEVLDLDNGDWSPLAPMLDAREYAASALVEGDQFWVLGGGSHGGSSTVEILDVARGSWQPGPGMKLSRFGAGAVWHNGRLFVAGGSSQFARKTLTTLEVLDPREGTEWQLHNFSAPVGPGYRNSLWGSGVAAQDHSLFLCGGAFREAEESQRTIFRIDTRTMELDVPKDGEGLPCCLQVPRWCGGACLL